MASAYLEIDERAAGSALVRLRSAVPDAPLSAAIEGCSTSAGQAQQTDAGAVRTWIARCPGNLAGADESAAIGTTSPAR